MVIYVCVGSSCHLKGSYPIIKEFQRFLDKYDLKEKVELKASFCLGQCTNGVSIKIDDEYLSCKSKEHAHEIFREYVLGRDLNGRSETEES